jgi:hypothetical protein
METSRNRVESFKHPLCHHVHEAKTADQIHREQNPQNLNFLLPSSSSSSTPAASHHSICSVSSWLCVLLFLQYTPHQIHPTTTTNPTNPTNPNSNNNKTFTPIFSSPLHQQQQQQQHKTHFSLPQNAKPWPSSSPKSYALGKAKQQQ